MTSSALARLRRRAAATCEQLSAELRALGIAEGDAADDLGHAPSGHALSTTHRAAALLAEGDAEQVEDWGRELRRTADAIDPKSAAASEAVAVRDIRGARGARR